MSLSPGTRVGPCQITGQIGEGGMGTVYHAHDTTLKRDVAIKVLRDDVAADLERLARFQREALAALNHPNVAQIYGIEKSDDTTALVMELVDGPTLAELLAAARCRRPRRWRLRCRSPTLFRPRTSRGSSIAT